MNSLPGVANFRDAGGLASGLLRRGRVFRSAHLSGMSLDDQVALSRVGVSDVYDLRTADEADRRPDSLPPGMTLHLIDVLADRPHSGAAAVASLINTHADRAAVEEINDAVGDGRARDLMIETYRHLVSLPSAHQGYRTLLTGLTVAPGATVIHCTAGKDRSGWAIALIQSLAGVDWDDVVADYLLSNEAMLAAYGPMLDAFAAEGGDAESLSHMIYVRPEYLAAAVTLVDHVFGGLDGYLAVALGLDDAAVLSIRESLLA